MNARINIKTSGGKSLEGFPLEVNSEYIYCVAFMLDIATEMASNPIITKGDTITIEIL